MVGPSNIDLVNLAKRLEDRTFKTYVSRIRAHQRLRRRDNAWNSSLIILSTSTTVSSVGLLVDREMYGRGGDALMLALAVLSLVASLVVASAKFGARAQAMESSYKRIQQISVAAENIPEDPAGGYDRLRELRHDYLIAIEYSENHSTADYARTANLGRWRTLKATWRDSLIGLAPYVTLVIPLALVVPFVRWFISGL